MASRKVPVHIPPCQMLRTATPVSAYQLSRMLRELPRTSKKTSPRRGSGAASDADMVPIVALNHRLCLVRGQLREPRPGRRAALTLASFPIPPARAGAADGMIVRRLAGRSAPGRRFAYPAMRPAAGTPRRRNAFAMCDGANAASRENLMRPVSRTLR